MNQDILSLVIVTIAVLYAGYSIARFFRQDEKSTCECGHDCSIKNKLDINI